MSWNLIRTGNGWNVHARTGEDGQSWDLRLTVTSFGKNHYVRRTGAASKILNLIDPAEGYSLGMEPERWNDYQVLSYFWMIGAQEGRDMLFMRALQEEASAVTVDASAAARVEPETVVIEWAAAGAGQQVLF